MPLPKEALRVEGGCNCKAVRYRLDIPEIAKRPPHPMAPADDPAYLPFLCFDHCNDCRRATGSLLPMWICALINIASVSLIRASSTTLGAKEADRETEEHGPWVPASDAFSGSPKETDTFLRSYLSSDHPGKGQRWRWFCSRCGTNIAYTAAMPEGWPDMLDVMMGSVDREYLDGDALVPERHLWWDYGIDWVRKLATKGYGDLPIHGNYNVGERVQLDKERL